MAIPETIEEAISMGFSDEFSNRIIMAMHTHLDMITGPLLIMRLIECIPDGMLPHHNYRLDFVAAAVFLAGKRTGVHLFQPSSLEHPGLSAGEVHALKLQADFLISLKSYPKEVMKDEDLSKSAGGIFYRPTHSERMSVKVPMVALAHSSPSQSDILTETSFMAIDSWKSRTGDAHLFVGLWSNFLLDFKEEINKIEL